MSANRTYTRPLDRSLEAYKAWIQNMVIRLGGSGGDMTEEQWIEAHREFWSDAGEPVAGTGNARNRRVKKATVPVDLFGLRGPLAIPEPGSAKSAPSFATFPNPRTA